MTRSLRPFSGHKGKREFTGACLRCDELRRAVPCNVLCCRHFLVTLAQEDLEDGLEAQPPFLDVLRRAPSGACFYLDESSGGCRNWAARPAACRAYDCRVDQPRASRLRRFSAQSDRRFIPETYADACRCCGTAPLRLLYDCKDACDERAVCVVCGAGYDVEFSYIAPLFTLRFVEDLCARKRREYLAHSFLNRERWPEALDILEALLRETPDDAGFRIHRATVLGELGRDAEACAELESIDSVEATLLLAWLDRRAGRLRAARHRLLPLLPEIQGPHRARALLALGRVARQAGHFPSAAGYLIKAFLEQSARPNEVVREYLLEMLRGTAEEQAAARAALRRRPGALRLLGLEMMDG